MSKLIKITPECVEDIIKDFKEALNGMVMADGKVSFTKSFGALDRKATLYFTELAWQKMQTLIREFDNEVAWHGIAKRGDDPEKDEYIITDILVYPQEVTSATVNTDQQKYEMWLMDLDDDSFNNLRMQGHSHVNMSTSPSGVDLTHQKEILDRLDDDMFYIFVIWNKKNDKTIKIYDFSKNVLFETTDVVVEIIEEDDGIQKFLSNAKELVKPKITPTYSYGSKNNYASGGYSGRWDDDWGNSWYGNGYYQGSSGSKASDKKSDNKSTPSGNSQKGKKKGKRKGFKHTVS